LLRFNDAEAVGTKLLTESSDEERKLQAQLQTMKLECNKFETLLASKDKELEKLKQELR
jgi:septal ring factor EnvC (AmiA/AmiB activator)